MMMQNEGDTNTEGKGLVQDASEAFFAKKRAFDVGNESRLTNPTFPMARVGVEFYLTTDLTELKNRVFGELESTAVKVDTAFQSIVNKMGDGAGLGASIRKNFTEAVSSVQLIGMDFKDVQTAAESTLEVFGRNVTLSGEEYKNLLATQQVTGQNVKQLEEGFLNAGMSIKDITKEMYNVTQVANAIGVNARLVSANVVSNLDKLNRYGFQSGVEGLAKMAAKAAALRIDLTDTLSIADDLMDPEGAIELASTLQRLGTTSAALTDPLRLMDMAQNDVGALQEELAKMFSTYAEFNEENQKFEILPSARRELKQLEKELGLPLGTIEKMAIGTKELDKKLSEISFSGFDVPQETQELIANMSMMNEEGEYMIKYIDPDTKDSLETTTTDFLEKFNGDAKKMQEALGRQKEEEGKSIEDKMFDRAGETLSSMQRIEAYNKAAADALGLATGGGEFGKQILESNEALAKSFNTSLIENMGPNGPIATAFNESAKKQQENFDILTGKEKGDKTQAAKDIATGVTDMIGTVATQAGNAAVGVLKDVGKTVGIDENTIIPGLTSFMSSVGITDQSLKDWTKTLTDSKNAILNLVPSGVRNIFQSTPPTTTTTTTTGPTSVVIPTQEVNTPTPLQQVNEITSLPIQNTAENLLAPEIQQATKEGMSQALDEELSYYSASPSLAVTIKKDETEGKRIQVPKKSEEIPTETNLVQQTNENVTEINQTETQQTTNLGNETNFNVLNEVFNTTNEELKDISVTNSSLLKTSTEAFDKSQSLITSTNTLLSSIQQSQTLVKSNNTVASTTTTTTISPTTAAAATTTEPTVTKPETPKAEETKETKIEVKKASKEDVGLFGQSPLMTGPLKIKEEEEIEKRTEFVTKLTDVEIKNYEDKKKEQVTFTDFLNKENEIRQESTKDIQKQKTISLDNQTQEFIFGQELNKQIIERDNYVTQFAEEEIRLIDQQNERQLSFNESFEQEIVKREQNQKNINSQNLVSSNTLKEQSSIQTELSNQTSTRNDLVTMMSTKELQTFEDKKTQQGISLNFLNKENDVRRETLKDIQKQKTTSLDNQTQEFIFGQELNEQIIERDNYVTQFTEEEIRRLDEKRENELSFNNLFNQETVKKEQSQKNIINQSLTDLDLKKQQISIENQMNNQTTMRKDLVTMMSAKESQTFEDKKNQQSTFTNFLNQENDVRRQTLEDIQKQKTTSLDSQNQEFIFGQQINEQIIKRDNYVTQFTEEEIRLLDEQREKQLSFNELFEQEIENRRTSTENNLTQQSTITNTNKEEISVGRQLNEQMVERNEFVTMLNEKEISMIDQQNERQLSFNNLLNEENSIREEYVTKLQETEKDKSVTSVVSGGELTKASETLSTVNKETVKNETKTVSEVARRIHERAKMLYDGVIDESEKSVATAINDAEVLKTPPTTTDTTKKIENQNLFENKPSVLGQYIATGKATESIAPTVVKPFSPEFKMLEDKSVTNFVNQDLPKPTGVNLFDTKPSLLGQYTATGKIPESTIAKPELPKIATEGQTVGEPSISTKDIQTITNNTDKTLQDFKEVVTNTDFGFGQEIPTSVAEFKGAEDVISQFFTPEAIAAVATPPVGNLDKKSEEYKEFMSTQNNNQTTTIGGEAKVKVEVTGIKDPTVERELIKSVRDSIINQMTFNYGTQQIISNAANMGSSNFGLTGAQTPGV